ncbi:MAG: polyphosphate:AMP phosphotransferase [Deltaproteobacteria bacterium]|nr:MAG: polyphosphate:AMP phosphotransferase [Deltaproteobacteria bacterium]
MIFQSAELGQSLSRDAFDALEPALREELLDLQFALQEARVPLVLLIAGVPGSGRGTTVEKLLHWIDARGAAVHAARTPVEVERERPLFYRYWQRVPGRGRMAIVLGGWVRDALDARATGRLTDADWERRLRRVCEFEQLLHHDGVRFVKTWLHLSETAQRAELLRRVEDPAERWRVSLEDWAGAGRYGLLRDTAAEFIQRTSTPGASWRIVEAADPRHRVVAVATHLRDTMREALGEPPRPRGEPDTPAPSATNVLSRLDLTSRLKRKAYRSALDYWRGRLRLLIHLMEQERHSLVLTFEGSDAAGKGGAIRRLTDAIDPRAYDIHAIAAPTPEEADHPWLWRFWRRLPRRGRVVIFDRSWYGRVLVERVEGFAHRDEWQRAWAEIRSFEEQLDEAGAIVLKFWLQIDPDEQLARFEAREKTGYKRYKLTDEDWRNREKWDAYVAASCDMIERTSWPHAPWVLVESNDKLWARVKVVRSTCAHLADRLGIDPSCLPGYDEEQENTPPLS